MSAVADLKSHKFFRFKFKKWDDHNPKLRNQKAVPVWFKCYADVFDHPALIDESPHCQALFMYMLCRATKRSGECQLAFSDVYHRFKLKQVDVRSYLSRLEALGIIENDFSLNQEPTADKTREDKTREDKTVKRAITERAVKPIVALADRPENSQVWISYSEAYQKRYGQEPARNAKNYGLCKQLVERIGLESAKSLVQFYLQHNSSWYVQKCHMLQFCVGDAEALLTQMRANFKVTNSFAHQQDKSQNNQQVFKEVLDMWNAKEEAQDDAAGT